jgi:hypothetical protein
MVQLEADFNVLEPANTTDFNVTTNVTLVNDMKVTLETCAR